MYFCWCLKLMLSYVTHLGLFLDLPIPQRELHVARFFVCPPLERDAEGDIALPFARPSGLTNFKGFTCFVFVIRCNCVMSDKVLKNTPREGTSMLRHFHLRM